MEFVGEVSIDFQRVLLRAGDPRPNVVIATADACIYCGSRAALEDEHVIPYGLEGEYVIEDGSCRECAKITSRFEGSVLSQAILPARTVMGFRSRHKKRARPSDLPILVDPDGSRTVREIPLSDHPAYIALPTFLAPALLRGAERPNLEVTPDVWSHLVGAKSLADVGRDLGGMPVGVSIEIDPYAFARMIGKIAHGFVAASDLGPIETRLPAAILESGESIGWFVGGAPDITITKAGLHGVEVHVIDGMVQVRVRLFAQMGAPEYLVVAGTVYEPKDGEEPSVSIEPALTSRRA